MEENTQKTGNPMLIAGIVVLLLIVGAGIVFASRGKATSTNTAMQNQSLHSSAGVPNTNASDPDNDGDSDITGADETSEAPSGQVAGTEDTANAQAISVEGGSFYYKPNEIHVKAGQPVKITLTSKDMMHDFTIDELNVKIPVTRAGQSNSVEFTPQTKGTYEFYCSVGNHRAQGQVGTLYIE